MVNTMQQVGGSIGTALLSTLAASAVTSQLAIAGGRPSQALLRRQRYMATRPPSGGRLASSPSAGSSARRC